MTTTTVPPAVTQSIGQALEADGRFSQLFDLLVLAGYTVDVQLPGPFTVFAPTDDAFAAMPPGQLEAIKADPTGAALSAFLSKHVVEAHLTSADLVDGPLETVNGAPITVSHANGVVMIDAATMLEPEIPASNGIIHPLDSVLTV